LRRCCSSTLRGKSRRVMAHKLRSPAGPRWRRAAGSNPGRAGASGSHMPAGSGMGRQVGAAGRAGGRGRWTSRAWRS
jgi:hypothetical protein